VTRLFRAVAAASLVACSSSPPSTEKTGTTGVADPANGCVLVTDASTGGYPSFEDLPSGSCASQAVATCQSVVGTPCCGTVNLALYTCSCAGGAWSCTVAGSANGCGPCAMDPVDGGEDAAD
jgi:hypothetical protein